MAKKIMRAKNAASPAIKNNPQKLLRLRILDETEVLESGQLPFLPNHASSICFILSPSVTFKIALDISGTRGEPLGKT
jgi:hypothetical protein